MATRPDLAGLFQVDPYGASALLGEQQGLYSQASKAGTGLMQSQGDEIRQKMQLEAQLAPLKQLFQDLQNQKMQAEMPGIRAESEDKQTTARYNKDNYDNKVEAAKIDTQQKRAKLTEEESKNYEKAIESAAAASKAAPSGLGQKSMAAFAALHQAGLGRDNPRAARLYQVLEQIPEDSMAEFLERMHAERVKGSGSYRQAMDTAELQKQYALQQEQMRGANQIALAREQASLGRWQQKQGAKEGVSAVQQSLDKASTKGALNYHAALVAAAKWAENNAPEKAVEWSAMAEAIRPQAEAQLAQGQAVPGKPNIPAVTGGAIPVNPNKSIAPAGAAAPAPAGRVRVVSPDGKSGTIPADQLEQAIKQGYKKAN